MAAPVVPAVLIGGFFAWRIFRRLRRNIGRQPLRPRRIITSLVIFSVLSVGLFVVFLQFPRVLLGLGGGLLTGALLGLLGLRLTKFETTEQGHFYTPNTFIGVSLTLLFFGRLIYRFWDFNSGMAQPHGPPRFQSPLTFLLFGLIAGYYIVYYLGLFVHTHDRK
jgi:MFS family permease